MKDSSVIKEIEMSISMGNFGLSMHRYKLHLLPNGMPVCKVGFRNPENLDYIECCALIDTGAEYTCLDPSIFDALNLEKSDLADFHISGFERDEQTVSSFLTVKIPLENWGCDRIEVVRWGLHARKEYRAIIGMNFLRKCRFVYFALKKEAWLEC